MIKKTKHRDDVRAVAYINPKEYRGFRDFLARRGMTFSGWVRAHIEVDMKEAKA